MLAMMVVLFSGSANCRVVLLGAEEYAYSWILVGLFYNPVIVVNVHLQLAKILVRALVGLKIDEDSLLPVAKKESAAQFHQEFL